MRLSKVVIILCISSVVSSCGSSPSQASTTSATPTAVSSSALYRVFSYVPPAWIDQRPPEILGPAIYYLDFAAMSEDLGLPDVKSADTRKAKLPFITRIATQGLSMVSPPVDPLAANAYTEWGWDVTDLTQSLYIPDLGVSVLLGDFSNETIKNALGGKGYTSNLTDGFTVFVKDGAPVQFALAQDTLLVAPKREVIDSLMAQGSSKDDSFLNNQSIQKLLEVPDSPHGFFLAHSGDLIGLGENLGSLPPPLTDFFTHEYQYGWDYVLIAFRSATDKPVQMDVAYSYPSPEEAMHDVQLVRESLTTTHSFRSISLIWSDFMILVSVEVRGSLVVAHATTSDDRLLGISIEDGDMGGFLPARLIK